MLELPQTPNDDKTNMVYMSTVAVDGQLFTDQTGRFPVASNLGNNYIVIFYAVDPNFIKFPDTAANSSKHTRTSINSSEHEAIAPSFTDWTTKHPRTLKTSSLKTTPRFSTHHQTCIEPTSPNMLYAPGKTTSSPSAQALQAPIASQTNAKTWSKPTSPSTCYAPAPRSHFSLPTKP
eukprot:CCRYP_000080-RB/>CCRYP_000080-RB protein AED:0.44 eAED:0.44 QI:0/0/0/1/0/0/2/0/176